VSIKEKEYCIILFYNYISIKNPEELKKSHFYECKKLNLLGRIIVSSEGINGTLSGLSKNIDKYIEILKKNKYFKNIDIKKTKYKKNVFKKLSVKLRKEIVSLKLKENIFPNNKKKYYLEPKKFYKYLQKENVFILDVRNDYEYNLGHFKNAINPNIKNFRDLPNWIEKKISIFKNKKILIYCTGGVRCEKISSFLKQKGINEVYQLKGGIIKYSQDKDIQGDLFYGKMYVFDQRISMKVNYKEDIIVGKDYFDKTPCERYINCNNPKCNKQILCSEQNEKKYLGSCSLICSLNNPNPNLKQKNKRINH
jgi:UPF0176 protein